MKGALKLASIKGIQVSIHWTFVLLLAWIVLQNVKSGLAMGPVVWTVIFVLGIFVCVILHELGHAMMAMQFGIRTRDITLYPIGGVARLETMPRKPKEELLVAIAGPAVNLVIALILYPFIDFRSISAEETLAQVGPANFLFAFAVVNIWLALFNLVPAFPMDGGRVFRALLSFRMDRALATKSAAMLGQLIAIGFIFLGFYVNPFLIFIGLFIILGAQSESSYAQAEALMEGHTVSDLTMHEMPLLAPDTTVSRLVSEVLNSQKKNFVVWDGQNVLGIVTQLDAIKALGDRGDKARVNEFMQTDILYLPSSMPVADAIVKMQSSGRSVALVRDAEQVVGMVDNDNLVEFILIQRAKQRLASVERK